MTLVVNNGYVTITMSYVIPIFQHLSIIHCHAMLAIPVPNIAISTSSNHQGLVPTNITNIWVKSKWRACSSSIHDHAFCFYPRKLQVKQNNNNKVITCRLKIENQNCKTVQFHDDVQVHGPIEVLITDQEGRENGIRWKIYKK
jgi:hypothetical protein